jgi:hypothetical protein
VVVGEKHDPGHEITLPGNRLVVFPKVAAEALGVGCGL